MLLFFNIYIYIYKGSVTTFSSWSFAIFKDLFNLPEVGSYSYRNVI